MLLQLIAINSSSSKCKQSKCKQTCYRTYPGYSNLRSTLEILFYIFAAKLNSSRLYSDNKFVSVSNVTLFAKDYYAK